MKESTETYTPTPGDLVLCDPDFNNDDLVTGKMPNCAIPANVLEVSSNSIKVEIIDERRHGKRVFTNTDRYGSICVILKEAIKPINE